VKSWDLKKEKVGRLEEGRGLALETVLMNLKGSTEKSKPGGQAGGRKLECILLKI